MTCSVNGERYRDMLQTLQQRVCPQETIFMRDKTPPDNVSSVQNMLRQALTDVRMNSRNSLASTIPRLLVMGLFER
ncbi:hypothetical protein TNCV_811821 [Trichonephila clavipes]|nr:hypothetical protein TNCV_811821 [Trichonephila clavipes]